MQPHARGPLLRASVGQAPRAVPPGQSASGYRAMRSWCRRHPLDRERVLHDPGEHRRRDLSHRSSVPLRLVEHDDRGEPRRSRPARTRRTTRRTGTAAARTAACARCRSCPPPCSRGPAPSRRCPPATTAASIVAHRRRGLRRDDRVGVAPSGRSWRCPSASIVAATRRGGRATPSLAIVAYTSSICIAVTAMPLPIGIDAMLVSLYCVEREQDARRLTGEVEPRRARRSRSCAAPRRSAPCRASARS